MSSVLKSPRERFGKDKETGKIGIDLSEVMQYTGHTQEQAIAKSKTCREDIANEWREKPPQTPEECNKFYTETEGYIYDLYTWTHDPEMWALFDKKITGNEKVLDYGCGIGDISIYLAEKGCDVVAAELPNAKTKQFAMWRTYQRKLGDKIRFAFDDAKETFDVTLAIDVLEHLHFPLRYVVQLTKLLKNRDSWFFFTPSFGNDLDVHPMHLEENYWLREYYPKAMVALGFAPEFVIEKYFPVWHPLFKTVPQGETRL